MKLEVVPNAYVHAVWPKVAQLIAPAYDHSDEYTLDQTRSYVSSGAWTLLVITKDTEITGALVVNVFNRPNDRVCFVQAIGGRDAVNSSIMGQLKVLSAQWGASTIECAARPSMVRLLGRVGMEPKYTVLKVAI